MSEAPVAPPRVAKKTKRNGNYTQSVVNPLTGENAQDYERTELNAGEVIHASSTGNSEYQKLEQTVLRWMNGLFGKEGVVVRNIGEDCSDGILLGKILNIVFKTPFSTSAVLTDANKRQNLDDLFVVLRDVFELNECDDYSRECSRRRSYSAT